MGLIDPSKALIKTEKAGAKVRCQRRARSRLAARIGPAGSCVRRSRGSLAGSLGSFPVHKLMEVCSYAIRAPG